jgi:integrase
MAKKTFVSKPRLVKGSRWYIDYLVFDSDSQVERRCRREFDLNEIENLDIREAVADRLVKFLEIFIRYDEKPAPPPEVPAMTTAQAVEFALNLKLATPQKNTHKNYKTLVMWLQKWLRAKSYAVMPITDFQKRHARAFFDWYITGHGQERKYRGVTINNRLRHVRALWAELVDREICPDNPWKSIKPVREEEKLRRVFTPEERRIVAQDIHETDYWLFRALLLQYYCYIRPVELGRMKFSAFDFSTGTVNVEVYKGKRKRHRWATIPKSVLHYFTDPEFSGQPANYYIFGLPPAKNGFQSIGPSPAPAHPNRLYKRHHRILQRLKKEKRLINIDGLTWYSWKDTGISAHAPQTSPLSTKDQAGHQDFDITMIYYHQQQINPEYRNLRDDLF